MNPFQRGYEDMLAGAYQPLEDEDFAPIWNGDERGLLLPVDFDERSCARLARSAGVGHYTDLAPAAWRSAAASEYHAGARAAAEDTRGFGTRWRNSLTGRFTENPLA